jgi:hypothetical protein
MVLFIFNFLRESLIIFIDILVTIQSLGWQENGKYLPLQDDISSVAYWYQTEPHAAFPELPDAQTAAHINTAPVNSGAKITRSKVAIHIRIVGKDVLTAAVERAFLARHFYPGKRIACKIGRI